MFPCTALILGVPLLRICGAIDKRACLVVLKVPFFRKLVANSVVDRQEMVIQGTLVRVLLSLG